MTGDKNNPQRPNQPDLAATNTPKRKIRSAETGASSKPAAPQASQSAAPSAPRPTLSVPEFGNGNIFGEAFATLLSQVEAARQHEREREERSAQDALIRTLADRARNAAVQQQTSAPEHVLPEPVPPGPAAQPPTPLADRAQAPLASQPLAGHSGTAHPITNPAVGDGVPAPAISDFSAQIQAYMQAQQAAASQQQATAPVTTPPTLPLTAPTAQSVPSVLQPPSQSQPTVNTAATVEPIAVARVEISAPDLIADEPVADVTTSDDEWDRSSWATSAWAASDWHPHTAAADAPKVSELRYLVDPVTPPRPDPAPMAPTASTPLVVTPSAEHASTHWHATDPVPTEVLAQPPVIQTPPSSERVAGAEVERLRPRFEPTGPFLARFLPEVPSTHTGIQAGFCNLHDFLRYLHEQNWYGYLHAGLSEQSAYVLVYEGRTVAAACLSSTGEQALGELLHLYEEGASLSAYPLEPHLAHVLSGVGSRAWKFNLTEDFTGLHARPDEAAYYYQGRVVATLPTGLPYEGAFPAPLRPQTLVLPRSLAGWAHHSYVGTLRGRDAINAITPAHQAFKAKFGAAGLTLQAALLEGLTPAEYALRHDAALHELEPVVHELVLSGYLKNEDSGEALREAKNLSH